MTRLLDQSLSLARLTLNDPRAGTRALLAMGIPLPARTLGLLLVAVCSALLLHLELFTLPVTDDAITRFMSESPLRSALIQWVILALTVLSIFQIGRMFGGRGSLPDALLVVVWLQVIMLAVQVAQLLALILFAPFAALLNLAGVVLFFWLFTSFVAELHGFASRWKVFAGVIGSGVAISMVLAVVMAIVLGPEVLQSV